MYCETLDWWRQPYSNVKQLPKSGSQCGDQAQILIQEESKNLRWLRDI